MKNLENKKDERFTATGILAQLDACADDIAFPMLDNGYIYPICSRLSTYRDDFRWAMIIEVFGFNPRGGITHSISNCLHLFGNCLGFPPGLQEDNIIYPILPSQEGSFLDNKYGLWLNPEVKSISLRNKNVAIEHDREAYTSKGIDLKVVDQIYAHDYLRSLLPEHETKFLATESELRERIPKDLPKFIELNQWNHPNLSEQEYPSDNETFILLSKALESGNKEIYKPTLEPNNHWKNWPHGGRL